MEGGLEATLPLESADPYRGTGGKMKKRLGRNSRAAATPYSRSKPSRPHLASGGEEGRGGRWWFSRIVDPAVRLISGGATKILPSLFTRPADDVEDGPDGVPAEIIEQDIEAVKDGDASHARALPDAEDDNSSRKVNVTPLHKDEDELLQIEQLIKGKNFSRDEINRLTEILQSRTAHCPATEEEQVNPVFEGDAGDLLVVSKVTKEANDKSQIRSEALWEVATPLVESNVGLVQDEIGASPVDIAKAYMGRRMSGVGSRSRNDVGTNDTTLVPGDRCLSRNLNHPSTLRKPPVCWPGATVGDQYMTPQDQRYRYGFQSFARSPYARSLRSVPKSRVSRGLLENDSESVGPIRRSKHGFAIGSPRKFSNVPASTEPFGRNFSLGGASTPVFKNMETGETSGTSQLQALDGKSLASEIGTPTVPSHSGQVARKILEHLDRTFPTPKDKAAELKLAFSWRKAESPISTQGVAMASEIEKPGSSVVEVPSFKSTANAIVIQEQSNVFKEATQNAVHSHGAGLSTLAKTGNVGNSSQTSNNEGTSTATPSAVETIVKDIPYKTSASSNKAALQSISVQKSQFVFPSDNGTGFTFPVTATQAAFNEPPTPSIIPATSGNSLPPPLGAAYPVPSYTFGMKRTSPPLIFSFPSTISSAINVDSSPDPVFIFGSSNKKRISFSSVGKDPICC